MRKGSHAVLKDLDWLAAGTQATVTAAPSRAAALCYSRVTPLCAQPTACPHLTSPSCARVSRAQLDLGGASGTLLAAIEADVAFLRSQRVIDYSLLVCE